MTRFEATDPRERLALAVDAVSAHRSRASEGVTLEGHAGEGEDDRHARVEFADRLVRLELDASAREGLDTFLGSFPVFKVKQPETRKAAEGVVYVSAIADPKHAAEFVDGLFREVYGLGDAYELRVVRV